MPQGNEAGGGLGALRARMSKVARRPRSSVRRAVGSVTAAAAVRTPVRSRSLRVACIGARCRIRGDGAGSRPTRCNDDVPAVSGGVRLPLSGRPLRIEPTGGSGSLSQDRACCEHRKHSRQGASHQGFSYNQECIPPLTICFSGRCSQNSGTNF